jgi:hypothetical protein
VDAVKWDGSNFIEIHKLASNYKLQNFLEYDADNALLIVDGDHAEHGAYVAVWPTTKEVTQIVVYGEQSFEYQFGKLH